MNHKSQLEDVSANNKMVSPSEVSKDVNVPIDNGTVARPTPSSNDGVRALEAGAKIASTIPETVEKVPEKDRLAAASVMTSLFSMAIVSISAMLIFAKSKN